MSLSIAREIIGVMKLGLPQEQTALEFHRRAERAFCVDREPHLATNLYGAARLSGRNVIDKSLVDGEWIEREVLALVMAQQWKTASYFATDKRVHYQPEWLPDTTKSAVSMLAQAALKIYDKSGQMTLEEGSRLDELRACGAELRARRKDSQLSFAYDIGVVSKDSNGLMRSLWLVHVFVEEPELITELLEGYPLVWTNA